MAILIVGTQRIESLKNERILWRRHLAGDF